MKVIDLLVKIANGEKAPEHIKCSNLNLYWNSENNTYDIREEGTLDAPFYMFDYSELNDEIEIIEEPKKIEHCLKSDRFLRDEDEIEHFRTKIDELIDEVNRLKGEK